MDPEPTAGPIAPRPRLGLVEVALLVLLVLAAVRFSHRGGGSVSSEDEALYTLLARGLEHGLGYAATWLPGTPRYTHAPPGFPALLAASEQAFGRGTFELVTTVATILVAVFAYILARLLAGRAAAIVCTLLLIGSPMLWRFSGHVMSEAPTQVLLLGSLAAGEVAARSDRWKRWSAVGLFLAAGALVTRAASLALLLAWIAASALPRQGRSSRARFASSAAAAGVLGVLIAAWVAWREGGGEEQGSYVRALAAEDMRDLDRPRADAAGFVARTARGAWRLGGEATDAIFHHLDKLGKVGAAVRAGLALLALVGLVLLWRRGCRLTVAWGVLCFGEAAAYPDFEGGRYFYPLLPLVFLCLWVALEVVAARWARAAGWTPIGIFLVLTASAARVTLAIYPERPEFLPPTIERYLEAADGLRRLARPGDVVVCRKPCILALRTGLYAVCYPYTRNATAHVDCIRSHSARWLVVDETSPTTREMLVPVLERLPIDPAPVIERGETRVYEVR